MSTLLKITASISGPQSQSTQLADSFIESWLQRNSAGRVVTRDLAREAIPHLTAERFQALSGAARELSEEQRIALDYSDELIAELKAADTLVIATPTHNFSVPSTLRAYFDHIARAGMTFRYTATGPQGLIEGKKAYVFITRGGFLPADADTQTAYVRQFLAFIGITDVTFVHAEGLNINEESRTQSLAAARHTIGKLVPEIRAA